MNTKKKQPKYLGSQTQWKVIAAAVQGKRHKDQEHACQDICQWQLPHSDVLVVVVADGAGSAKFGEVGAKLATQVAVDKISSYLTILPLPVDNRGWEELLITTGQFPAPWGA